MARAKKKNQLDLSKESTEDQRRKADVVVDPLVSNVTAAKDYLLVTDEEVTMQCHIEALRKQAKAVHEGKMEGIESMLVAQAHTLDAIFVNLAMRASSNMQNGYLEATDMYLRLALRSQSQCRATLETLATIRNPSVVFARQANIAHGHQQVNNGTLEPPARVKNENAQTELLEHEHGNGLDVGAAQTPVASYSTVEAVAKVHGAADSGRKGGVEP